MPDKLFGNDKDEAQRIDRRGTGDEAPEHPPTVVARPEDAGHATDPQAGSHPSGRSTPAETRRVGHDNTAPDASYRPDPPNHNPARDEGRSLDDEAKILADNLIGQKPTAEGTAGHSGTEPPKKHAE